MTATTETLTCQPCRGKGCSECNATGRVPIREGKYAESGFAGCGDEDESLRDSQQRRADESDEYYEKREDKR